MRSKERERSSERDVFEPAKRTRELTSQADSSRRNADLLLRLRDGGRGRHSAPSIWPMAPPWLLSSACAGASLLVWRRSVGVSLKIASTVRAQKCVAARTSFTDASTQWASDRREHVGRHHGPMVPSFKEVGSKCESSSFQNYETESSVDCRRRSMMSVRVVVVYLLSTNKHTRRSE